MDHVVVVVVVVVVEDKKEEKEEKKKGEMVDQLRKMVNKGGGTKLRRRKYQISVLKHDGNSVSINRRAKLHQTVDVTENEIK